MCQLGGGGVVEARTRGEGQGCTQFMAHQYWRSQGTGEPRSIFILPLGPQLLSRTFAPPLIGEPMWLSLWGELTRVFFTSPSPPLGF